MKLATALVLFVTATLNAADWPHWRGPAFNGISSEEVPAFFPAAGPKVAWKAAVGIGFSSFAVADGKVYTLGHAGDKDTVFCFDAVTGKEAWKHSYDAELGDKYYEGGPSSTPTVDGGKVYTLSKWGDVFCFDAKTGSVVWNKNFAKDLKIEAPGWGFAGSPRVSGSTLYLNIGSLGMAADKASGKVLWSSDNNIETAYSTPTLAKVGASEVLVVANAKGYNAVDPKTGNKLWNIQWVTRYGVNASDPIFSGSKMFVSTGYGKGCVLYDLQAGESKLVYQNREMRNQMSPSVLIDGFLYGIDGDEGSKTALKCMELATGTVKWQQPVQKLGSVIAAKDKLIVLGGKGELVIAKASSAGFEQLAAAQVLDGRCWTPPVLANSMLYCRNAAGDVVALQLK